MKTLNLDLGDKSYPIYIGQNLLNQKALLSKHIPVKIKCFHYSLRLLHK
jgi:3-dehydroquinate synthase